MGEQSICSSKWGEKLGEIFMQESMGSVFRSKDMLAFFFLIFVSVRVCKVFTKSFSDMEKEALIFFLNTYQYLYTKLI